MVGDWASCTLLNSSLRDDCGTSRRVGCLPNVGKANKGLARSGPTSLPHLARLAAWKRWKRRGTIHMQRPRRSVIASGCDFPKVHNLDRPSTNPTILSCPHFASFTHF